MSLAKSLVVFGGNGLLGRSICQRAIESGWKVTSISRSGKIPNFSSKTPISAVSALSKVNWKAADVFDPETYKEDLETANAVVHSIGILLENDYKSVLSSPLSLSTPMKLFDALLGNRNPLNTEKSSSYERVNRDSAIILAKLYNDISKSKAIEQPLVYVSADRGFPGVPLGYIKSKREAESQISQLSNLRSIFLRPGFMYDEEDGEISPRNVLNKVVQTAHSATECGLKGVVRPTVSVQQVAKSGVEGLVKPSVRGVVFLEDILSA